MKTIICKTHKTNNNVTEYHSEIAQIRELIGKNPRGLTIKEISELIQVNRNSVAKYLDVMVISGDLDQRVMGRAKIYYPSNRIPISNILDFSSDLICVIDNNNLITQLNENFSSFFNLNPFEIVGKESWL